MRTFLGLILAALCVSGCASRQGPATRLETANVLPLGIDDAYQFRKVKRYLHTGEAPVLTQSEMVAFERRRYDYGTYNSIDRDQRYGNYYTFFWRTSKRSDVTVRFEYRQAALGNYVMAQERYYPDVKGSHQSDFTVTGDEYRESGQVTAWRVLLIVDGRIVGLRQSFIWK